MLDMHCCCCCLETGMSDDADLLRDLLRPETDIDAVVQNFVNYHRASRSRDPSAQAKSPQRPLFAPSIDDTQDEGIQTDSVMVRVLHSPPRTERVALRPPTPEFVKPDARFVDDDESSYSYSSYTGSSSSHEETVPPAKSVVVPARQAHRVTNVPVPIAPHNMHSETEFRKLLVQAPEQRRKKVVTVQSPTRPQKAKTTCFC